MGAVSRGARLGHGAGGLQRERRCLELFSARSRPIARLSLGRRWNRRHLGFQTAALPGVRVLEWPRSDPERTPLRRDRAARVSWRGCEGSLFLHRLHADPQLHADALPLSAGAFSLRGAGGGESRPAQAGPEFELWDTGILREHRYFDISLEYAKVDPDDFFISRDRNQPRPGRRRSAHPADALVPEHVVLGTRRSAAGASGQLATWRSTASTIQASHRGLGEYKLHCEGARDLLFTENETNSERLFSSPNQQPFVKDGINDFIVHGRTRGGESGARGNKSRGALRFHDRARREPGDPPLVRPRGRSDRGRILRASPERMPRPVCLPVLDRKGIRAFRCRRQKTPGRGGRVLRRAGAVMLER